MLVHGQACIWHNLNYLLVRLTQHGANIAKVSGSKGWDAFWSIQGLPSIMPHSMADTPPPPGANIMFLFIS